MATIRNRKLRQMLNEAGYQNYCLVKGEGYFYVDSEEYADYCKLSRLMTTDIMCNSFNQQSVEEWFQDIVYIIKKAEEAERENLHRVEIYG